MLLILLVAAGGIYTYLSPEAAGSQASAQASAVTDAVIKPSVPSKDAPASASVQVMTTPVMPGTNAGLTIKTVAGANCTIVALVQDAPIKDSGLLAKDADAYGTVSWTWTVAPTAPLGTWPVTVTCVYNGRSAVVKADLVIAKVSSTTIDPAGLR